MVNPALSAIHIRKVSADGILDAEDVLAIEEPLEIRLVYKQGAERVTQSISVTMRTPGNDAELATGFLFTEGIIKSPAHISQITEQGGTGDSIVTVVLADGVEPETAKLERNFYTTSSCGVCGKTSIAAVKTIAEIPPEDLTFKYAKNLVHQLPEKLRNKQDVFEQTGGLHASAIFDINGTLVMSREDVGRHNALDKLIGAALQQEMLPLNQYLLLLSGRASFELIQKAAMAGIKIVAAVGAPSSLAVELAQECGMTLIGFLRNERFNIYTGAQRIV